MGLIQIQSMKKAEKCTNTEDKNDQDFDKNMEKWNKKIYILNSLYINSLSPRCDLFGGNAGPLHVFRFVSDSWFNLEVLL